jgi:hypothetical protein
MSRYLRASVIAFLLSLPLMALFGSDRIPADQVPEITAIPQPQQPVFQNPVFTNPEVTAEPPTPTPGPTATPAVSPETFLWLDVRRDLEILADDRLGVLQRPQGWTGTDTPWTSPDLPLLTRLDLELLATAIINPDVRPTGWIGTVASTAFAVARDGRHDLELLADLVYGRDQRPQGWTGADPLLKCSRATQTLINLLERGGVYRLQVDPNDPQFCRAAEVEVTVFTEQNILGNAQIGNLFTDELIILSPHTITSDIAVSWLDSSATRQVGIIPRGTPIQIVGRSYADFSRMMLVAGDNFEVFVEYTTTSVDQAAFRRLPNVTGLSIAPYCFADWCQRSN